MRDAWRLAWGTLSVLPVRPPSRVDARTAARAMTLAPVVGLLLGVAVLVPAPLLADHLAPPVVAALLVAGIALLTRGMHLDGLADTADGLGSGRLPADALAVMRRGDVGPFGVAAVVLVALVQTAALAACLARGAPTMLLVALVVSRSALPMACRRGVPPARPDGLGATVAGRLGRLDLATALALAVAATAVAGLLPVAVGGPVWQGTPPAQVVLAALAPWLVAEVWLRHCVRRLGGVTGDVLGATVEVTFTASLLVLAGT
ncbi:MAG: adenosylcobinamide-GDP ribazoletransferase [Nocardioidaceae bacterium]